MDGRIGRWRDREVGKRCHWAGEEQPGYEASTIWEKVNYRSMILVCWLGNMFDRGPRYHLVCVHYG